MALTISQKEKLASQFESFLNLNYNCTCGDVECTNNYYEAQFMADIVEKALQEAGITQSAPENK